MLCRLGNVLTAPKAGSNKAERRLSLNPNDIEERCGKPILYTPIEGIFIIHIQCYLDVQSRIDTIV